MFNLSFGEIMVLSAIGLLVLGPKQLPQVAKVLGRTYSEFRKAFHDVTNVVKTEMHADIFKKSMTHTIAGSLVSDSKSRSVSKIVDVITENSSENKLSKASKSIDEVMRELGK